MSLAKQTDAILLFKELCGASELIMCKDASSEIRYQALETTGDDGEQMRVKANDGLDKRQAIRKGLTKDFMCNNAVPFTCPRIRCYNDDIKDFVTCRRVHLAEEQKNEHGTWVRLPCSTCHEKKKLSETTKGFEVEINDD